LIRKYVNGFLEVHLVDQLDKADRVSAFIAAKAVPQVFIRIYREGRLLVVMERALSFIALAVLLEFYASGFYQGQQVNVVFDGLDSLLCYFMPVFWVHLFFSLFLAGQTTYLAIDSTILVG